MDIICVECETLNKNNEKLCLTCKFPLILNKKYNLVKILNENTEITYLALDIHKDKKVIIKELSLRTLGDWKTSELFDRESNTLSQLKHPLIPSFIEHFTLGLGRNQKVYTVIEYIEGIDLEYESKNKNYKQEEVLKLIKEIAKILEYIHSFNPPIIHRDLKPSNIIRKSDGNLALIDFGSISDLITPLGGSTIVGTFGYMPLEQYYGKSDKTSDYYSLGVIAVVLLSGRKPEDMYNDTEFEWNKHINVAEKFKFLLKKLLEPHKDKRISSSKEIIELIDEIIIDKNRPSASYFDYKKLDYLKKENPYKISKKIIATSIVSVITTLFILFDIDTILNIMKYGFFGIIFIVMIVGLSEGNQND